MGGFVMVRVISLVRNTASLVRIAKPGRARLAERRERDIMHHLRLESVFKTAPGSPRWHG